MVQYLSGTIVSFFLLDLNKNKAKMPKEIINMNLERKNNSEKWGFNVIGGKDQALTLKVGKIKVNL